MTPPPPAASDALPSADARASAAARSRPRRFLRSRGADAPDPEGQRRCGHCGSGFRPRFEEERFCCAGCRVVHELIEGGGFDTFYDLLGDRRLQPADQGGPSAEQAAELAEAVAEAETDALARDGAAKLALRLGNLSCTACVWLIDHLFRQRAGALKVNSDTSRSILTLWWTPGEFDPVAFVEDLHRYGYPASLVDALEELPQESRSLLTRLGVTGGLAMNTMAFTLPVYLGLDPGDELARLFTLVAFASASLALATGGSYFFQRAWGALRAGTLHIDVPISLGLAAAYLGSVGGYLAGVEKMLYFDFVAVFAFLMLLGRWLHLHLVEKNQRQLWARERDLSSTFRLEAGGRRERIALAKVLEGDTLEIPSGAMVPVDSLVLGADGDEERLEDGRDEPEESHRSPEPPRFHLDWINGEPDPHPYRPGQTVPAGAKNAGSVPVRVRARGAFADTFLEQLLKPADRSGPDQGEDFGAASLNGPVLKYYLATVLAVAFLGAAGWIASGAPASRWLQVFISVLIVSCPCALGVALPLLEEMALAKLRRTGIFLRRDTIWRRLKKIRTLAFDKTGTLTEPVKKLVDPDALEALAPEALAALRRLVESNHHPAARALHEELVARYGLGEFSGLDEASSIQSPEFPESAEVVEVVEHPGCGVETYLDGTLWRLGRPDWALDAEDDDASAGTSGDCVLSRDGATVARFALSESLRDGALEQLDELRRRGYRLRILSGDPDAERVAATAARLGLPGEDARAGLAPEEKAAILRTEPPGSVLFVGDGGNDGPAFDCAAVSGTPATGVRAIESRADFVFTGRGFHAIGQLLDLARRRQRLVRAIFFTAVVYNLTVVAIALAGHMNPLLAAVVMPLSSIVATARATRI